MVIFKKQTNNYKEKLVIFAVNRDHINKKSKETRVVTYAPADILADI